MSRIQICLLYFRNGDFKGFFLKEWEIHSMKCHLSCSTFLLIVHTFWTIIPWKMHTKTLRFSHCHSFAKYIFMQTWHLWVFWRVFDKTDRPDWFPPFVLWISLLVYFGVNFAWIFWLVFIRKTKFAHELFLAFLYVSRNKTHAFWTLRWEEKKSFQKACKILRFWHFVQVQVCVFIIKQNWPFAS